MFYEFRQNNSGGSFDYNEYGGISVIVIVEANSAQEANLRAQSIGLYFDGSGDCPCCGDRWSEQWREDGTEVPSHYGQPIALDEPMPTDNFAMKWMTGHEGFVHYADGRVVGFW